MKRVFVMSIFLGVCGLVSQGLALPGNVWSEVKNNVAYVHSDDVYLNCCPDTVFETEYNLDTIDIFEIDLAINPCKCICYFDFTHEFSGLAAGSYLARVFTVYKSEDPVLSGATAFTISQEVGTSSVSNKMSECHNAGIGENPTKGLDVQLTSRSPLTVSYDLDQAGLVRIQVYDASGSLVRTLDEGFEDRGRHRVRWDAKTDAGLEVSRGVYFMRLETQGRVQSLPLVILR